MAGIRHKEVHLHHLGLLRRAAEKPAGPLHGAEGGMQGKEQFPPGIPVCQLGQEHDAGPAEDGAEKAEQQRDQGAAVEKDHQHHHRQRRRKEQQAADLAHPEHGQAVGQGADPKEGEEEGQKPKEQGGKEQFQQQHGKHLGKDQLPRRDRDGAQILEGVVVPLHEEQKAGQHPHQAGHEQHKGVDAEALAVVVKPARLVSLGQAGHPLLVGQLIKDQQQRQQRRQPQKPPEKGLALELEELAPDQVKQSPHPLSPA